MLIPGLYAGLQELLCDGTFVDVRISCSDHSPIDGLGSHKAMLAAASPRLLGDCLDTSEEEDMVCLLLPDFSSTVVSAVLSILYYGEIWVSQVSHEIPAINSLFRALGLPLVITGRGKELVLQNISTARGMSVDPEEHHHHHHQQKARLASGNNSSSRQIKKEPIQDFLCQQTSVRTSKSLINIKKEKFSDRCMTKSFIPTVQTATVQTSSLLKCPNVSCDYHSTSIPDMQTHISGCQKLKQHQQLQQQQVEQRQLIEQQQQQVEQQQQQHQQQLHQQLEQQPPQQQQLDPSRLQQLPACPADDRGIADTATPLHHVELKPMAVFNIKREQNLSAIKQESVDPLEKKVETEVGDAASASTVEELTAAAVPARVKSVPPEAKSKFMSPLKMDNLKVESEACEEDVTHELMSISDSSESNMDSDQVFCVKCTYMTNSKSSLQAHVIMHQRKETLKENKTTCPVCQTNFKSLIKLKEHLTDSHSKEIKGTLNCSIDNCSKTFKKSTKLKISFYHHVLYDHYPHKFKLKCDNCDFQTVTTSKLKQHLMLHEDERPFICAHCPNSFRTKTKLLEHASLVHEKQQSFSCRECDKTFVAQRQLKKHVASKHSTIRLACDQCPKVFTDPASLKTHCKKVHEQKENNSYMCEKCANDRSTCTCRKGKGASSNSSSSSNETVFCPVCGKKMVARLLACHLHYHRQSSLRPFICQECSKTFTHAASLKRHALLHTGQKRFTCEQCGKQFYQKTAYETHCRSHSTERLSCNGCGKLFLTQYLLNFHLKSKKACKAVYAD